MSSNLLGLVIAAIGTIITVAVAVGLPALAIVAVKFFRFKERELTLGIEHRQRSEQQELALEQRVQRLEDALAALDHPSDPDLFEGPAGPEAQRLKSRNP